MNREQRRCGLEIRDASGDGSPGIVGGRLVTFGEWADIGGMFRERIAQGGMVPESRVVANVQHMRGRPLAATGDGGGLSLAVTDAGIDARIRLPDTTDGRDTATLVREGVLTGLSVEMAVRADLWAGQDRTITDAVFDRIGIVDTPAYAGSLLEEIRERHDGDVRAWLRRFWV